MHSLKRNGVKEMITRQQAEKLKELANNFADSQSDYDKAISRVEDGDSDLAYEELTYNKSVLYGFIEGLTNDNKRQN